MSSSFSKCVKIALTLSAPLDFAKAGYMSVPSEPYLRNAGMKYLNKASSSVFEIIGDYSAASANDSPPNLADY